MKGKKILVLLLVLLLTATLFACGNNSSNEGGSDTPDATENEWPAAGSQIRLVITHGVGGSVDMAARGIAPFL